MKAYKGFDKELKCRGFQYEVGGEYTETNADICKYGFHACEAPLDVFDYYPPGKSRYCEVELDANEQIQNEDSKRVGKHIKIGAEIGISELVRAHFEYVKKNTREFVESGSNGAATAGDRGGATAGYRGVATAGDHGAATAGDCGAATAGEGGAATAGYSGAATAGHSGAATAGYSGVATAGEGGAATAGDCGAATSCGKSATGKEGLSVARGNDVRVKGGIGAVIVIVEEKANCNIKEWKAAVVDGKNIKADTWYKLVGGEFVEVGE